MKNKLNLSPIVGNKIKTKRTITYVSAGLGILTLLIIGTLFYFNVGNIEETKAENGTYSSARNGSWYTAATWKDWANPSYNNFPDWNSIFNINHHVTYGDLKLKSGNKLIVSGTLEVSSIEGQTQLSIEVKSTGKLIVNGDITNKSGGFKFLNNGEVIINGSLNANGQGTSIENNNKLTILQTLNVDNGLIVTNKKDFNVGMIKAGNNFSIINKGDFETSTSIEAGNSFKIDNDGKFSSSEIKADNDFTLTTKGNFEVEGITAGNQLKINSEGEFISSGEIKAKENFTLNTKGNFEVEGITAGNQLKITTEGEFTSSGEIKAKENFTLNTTGDFEVESITAGNQFKLTSNGEFISKGNIEAGNNFDIDSEGVLIVVGDIEGGNQFKINSKGEMVVTGDINSGNNFGSTKDFLYVYGELTTGSHPNVKALLDDMNLKNNNIELYNLVQMLLGEGLLPITLESFNATVTLSQSVLVIWSTFSEKDNDFFTLERSSDGKKFETIATLEGAGTSNKKLHYSFEDKIPVEGMNYYRLKQTDFNGDFEYFKIVGVHNKASVNILSKAASQVETWPNPFRDHVNVSFESAIEGDADLLIQNTLGEIVYKANFYFNYGKNTYTFENMENLKSGVYYVTLWQNGKKQEPQKLIKI